MKISRRGLFAMVPGAAALLAVKRTEATATLPTVSPAPAQLPPARPMPITYGKPALNWTKIVVRRSVVPPLVVGDMISVSVNGHGELMRVMMKCDHQEGSALWLEKDSRFNNPVAHVPSDAYRSSWLEW